MHTVILVRKPEWMRLLLGLTCREEDSIKMDLKEIRWGVWNGFIWLGLGFGFSGRLVNMVMNIQVL
jgi:hypothetical protein